MTIYMCTTHIQDYGKNNGSFEFEIFSLMETMSFFKAHSSPSYSSLNVLTWKCCFHISFNSHAKLSLRHGQAACASVHNLCVEVTVPTTQGLFWNLHRQPLQESHPPLDGQQHPGRGTHGGLARNPTQLRHQQAAVTMLMSLDQQRELHFFVSIPVKLYS